jgi:hypothetical protein
VADTLQRVHVAQRGLVHRIDLADDRQALAGRIQQPGHMPLAHQVQRKRRFSAEVAGPSGATVGGGVWKALLEGAEDEDEGGHGVHFTW